jgi:glycosyltransferase involved in cell wall biosynthesis
MNKKLISILTPTHNRADKYLPQTIASIMAQKESGFDHEHIIVDNLSQDNTEKVVTEFMAKDKRIKYIRNNRNLGAADGLNVAFKKAKGDLIVPLDDDDMLPLSSLQYRFNFFQADKKVKWAYGQLIFIDPDNKLVVPLREYNVPYVKAKNYVISLLKGCFIPNGSVTIKRDEIEKAGRWNPKIKTQDFDLWLRLAANNVKPHDMNSYLCLYRIHPKQNSLAQAKDGTYVNEREYYLNRHAKDAKYL